MTLHVFLGGHDLEMVTIRDLLQGRGVRYTDKRLAWGARLSAYAHEIEAAHAAGDTPVAVELIDDMPTDWSPRARLIDIDHHGARSAEPCSLRQMFDLLRLPEARWTRRFALVAANDTGHIAALRRMGASEPEITAIRAGDRAAQGITPEEEAAGLAALAAATRWPDGTLVVTLPHGRTATVTDPLAIAASDGDEGAVVVFTPTSTNFFGSGAAIAALDAAFPGGWRGGELPRRGFWGVGWALTIADVRAALFRPA